VIATAERRLAEIGAELTRQVMQETSESDVAAALAEFDTLWAALTAKEQALVTALLIECIAYDDKLGIIDIKFWPSGIKAFASEVAEHEETPA
jgi:site-specific DNA recombinase